jgi:glycosyltransferase involved in cell wall biosynthesis
MVAQTVKPLRWVIVSDGSTDETDSIVERYASNEPWIELVRMPERRERHFSGKVYAFNAGYERVRELPYQAIASLDADISFDADYFAFLLQKLADDPGRGLVGTPFYEGSAPVYDYRFVNIEHVSGACQLFRRRCFEDIGGYVPVKGGGIDYIAVVTARMKGWKTRTFTDKLCHHHREIGTAQNNTWSSRFKYGAKDYALGHHPLWEVFRTVYQTTKQPYLIGGVALGCGYCWAMLRRAPRPVSRDLMAFTRHEQIMRLRKLFKAPGLQAG